MKNNSFLIIFLFALYFVVSSCNKQEQSELIVSDSSDLIRIDSLVATKRNIVCWEEIFITAYTTGDSLTYLWSTNHGSMYGKQSSTVKYWACYSCTGNNVVQCKIENKYGVVTDTIMINVTLEK